MTAKKRPSPKKTPTSRPPTITAEIGAELSKIAAAYAAIAGVVVRETSRLAADSEIQIVEKR